MLFRPKINFMKNVMLFLFLCISTSVFCQHGVRIYNQTACDFTVTIESFDYFCNAVDVETLTIPANSAGSALTSTPNSRWLRAVATSSPVCPPIFSQVPIPASGAIHTLALGSPCPFTCNAGLPPSTAISNVLGACCGPVVRGEWTFNSHCGEIIIRG